MRLIVVASKANNNGEAQKGGKHDHEHSQAPRRALEDHNRLRCRRLGARVRLRPSRRTKIIVGLITKTNTNPFFAKMKEGAAAKAKELGVDFRSFAGKYDGDNTGQVDAIEQLMSAGPRRS